MYNNIAALWKKTKTFVAVATIWLSNGGYPVCSNQIRMTVQKIDWWCVTTSGCVSQIMQHTGVFFRLSERKDFLAIYEMESKCLLLPNPSIGREYYNKRSQGKYPLSFQGFLFSIFRRIYDVHQRGMRDTYLVFKTAMLTGCLPQTNHFFLKGEFVNYVDFLTPSFVDKFTT